MLKTGWHMLWSHQCHRHSSSWFSLLISISGEWRKAGWPHFFQFIGLILYTFHIWLINICVGFRPTIKATLSFLFLPFSYIFAIITCVIYERLELEEILKMLFFFFYHFLLPNVKLSSICLNISNDNKFTIKKFQGSFY